MYEVQMHTFFSDEVLKLRQFLFWNSYPSLQKAGYGPWFYWHVDKLSGI